MCEYKFTYGDLVAYCLQDNAGYILKIELGVFKRYSDDMTAAFIWYHEGDVASRTPLQYLYPIDNAWYFNEDAKKLGGSRDD